MRCGLPRRTPSARSRRSPLSSACRPGSNLPLAELFRRKYGMQAGNIVGIGSFMPSYVASPITTTGLSSQVTPFWGVAGKRRRGRGRYRDRTVPRDAARQRRRCRQADQSAARPGAALGRGDHAVRLHRRRRTWCSATGSSPTARSPTTRSRLLDLPRDFVNETRRVARSTTAPSAPRAPARARR